jgi:hypothetical protein
LLLIAGGPFKPSFGLSGVIIESFTFAGTHGTFAQLTFTGYGASLDPWASRKTFGRLDPSDANALYNRGLAKRKAGDTAGGDADIAKAKQLDPKVNPEFATDIAVPRS